VKAALVGAALFAVLTGHAARADNMAADAAIIRGCITAAAAAYRLPPAVLVVLLDVEGGRLGGVSENTNGTVDIGPMQVNTVNLPGVAAHWHATLAAAYEALRDDFCANVEAGAWLLRRSLDATDGHFWEGVGDYHSHTPEYRRRYLWQVLQEVLRLRALAERSSDPRRSPGIETAEAAAAAPAGGG
jgi:hypothetical protein